MKKFFCVCVALMSVSAFCQKNWKAEVDFSSEDSALLAQGLIPVAHQYLLGVGRFCFDMPEIIDTDRLLQVLKQKCHAVTDSVDINKYILLNRYFGGDCHVRFRTGFYLDTANKKLIWKVYNIWGGCRAAGGRRFVAKVPKPPAGYAIVIDEILVEFGHDDYFDEE